jgi:hypothetical protein
MFFLMLILRVLNIRGGGEVGRLFGMRAEEVVERNNFVALLGYIYTKRLLLILNKTRLHLVNYKNFRNFRARRPTATSNVSRSPLKKKFTLNICEYHTKEVLPTIHNSHLKIKYFILVPCRLFVSKLPVK